MLDALRYKRSRYFNLEWFAFNQSSTNDRLDLGYHVKTLLDPTRNRIVVKNMGDRKVFCFWSVKNKKVDKLLREVVVKNNNNVLNVKKTKCHKDAHIIVIGIKLGFLRWEKKYKTLFKVSDIVYFRKHMENGIELVELRDIYYNKIRILPSHLIIISQFFCEFFQLRNLKQYKGKEHKLVSDLKIKYPEIAMKHGHFKKLFADSD